jgi:Ser/Thr protein kinase RdoA (MazF antagonist)
MNSQVTEVCLQYFFDSPIIEVLPFGSGLINSTYKLRTASPNHPGYLLQKINHLVFKNVAQLMDNINRVNLHITNKITKEEAKNGITSLNIIPTKDGYLFYQDSSGCYWRIYYFLGDLKSHDDPKTLEQIYEGAKSFGRFIRQLDDFPSDSLHATIPRFHDVKYRLDNLDLAIKQNFNNRKSQLTSQLKFIDQVSKQLSKIQELGLAGEIPVRVTHNDTKFNNVLLGADNKGKCVVDLDTVMPGYVHYDFGDGLRTTISTSDEDEKDLNKINVDLDRFEAFAKGFLEMSREILTAIEMKHLALSGPLMSYIMGIRFLTDYLSGDHYYQIDFETHNLQRANCQLDLTDKMLSLLPEMNDIMEKHI